jgi:biopolymer transport protein ExbB
MNNIIQMLSHGVEFGMIAISLFSLVVIADRVQALYFKSRLDTNLFLEKIKGYVMADKIDEAISFAATHSHTPLGRVTKSVLERADRDDEAMHQALDIALAEAIPTLTKKLGYLSMTANVAMLLGLFGTITGLIMSFQALSFADPSQKQTLLAQGISVSMNHTAYGLCMAIPILVIYSVLHARQSALIEALTGGSAKLMDMLSARNYRGFESAGVYNGKGRKEPPAAGHKAS